MRQLGGAIESYAAIHGGFPRASSMTELVALLPPEALPSPATLDGWSRELRYELSPGTPSRYVLRSAAKDGEWDGPDLPDGQDITRYFDCDIVWASGDFVRMPEGISKS